MLLLVLVKVVDPDPSTKRSRNKSRIRSTDDKKKLANNITSVAAGGAELPGYGAGPGEPLLLPHHHQAQEPLRQPGPGIQVSNSFPEFFQRKKEHCERISASNFVRNC